MKHFEDLKKQYKAIQAPSGLKERIEKDMKKQIKKTKLFKVASAVAATLVITTITAFNTSPNLVSAMPDNPVLNAFVKVITFGKYEVKDNGYEAKVVTPQIEGLLDKEFEDKLNQEFKENAKSIIAAFEKDVKELKSQFGDETVYMGLEYDFIIKTDNADVLAIDTYILNIAGSSSTKHTFYNIDKKTGKLLTLKGLFKKDANYVDVLSKYIKAEMKRRNDEESGMFWIDSETDVFETFDKIKADQNFYINSDGNIVICFDKYDVAAGAQGSPEFIIPHDVIADILY